MAKSRKPKVAPKIIGFTSEQAAAAKQFQETVAKNTPIDIIEAFFPNRVALGEIDLKPVDLGSFMLLEKIASPLAVAAAQGGDAPMSFRDLAAALLVLSLDPDAAEALTSDREKFDAAVPIFARRIPAEQILDAGKKVVDQIQKAFATAIQTGAPDAKKGSSGDPLPTSAPGARS